MHMSADKSHPITRKKNKKIRISYGRPLKSIFEDIFLCIKNVKMLHEYISSMYIYLCINMYYVCYS